ncbi:MAG: hypothetical protein KAR15_20080, partial [Desulfobacterales bacterium]|nr:hypothetical protein [Desulfobacterales bacterium]
YFIEEKLIQVIAELKKWKVSGTVGVRFFYSLLKIRDVESFGLPDHFGDRRGTGIAQKHGVLGSVAEGSRKPASTGSGSSTED